MYRSQEVFINVIIKVNIGLLLFWQCMSFNIKCIANYQQVLTVIGLNLYNKYYFCILPISFINVQSNK